MKLPLRAGHSYTLGKLTTFNTARIRPALERFIMQSKQNNVRFLPWDWYMIFEYEQNIFKNLYINISMILHWKKYQENQVEVAVQMAAQPSSVQQLLHKEWARTKITISKYTLQPYSSHKHQPSFTGHSHCNLVSHQIYPPTLSQKENLSRVKATNDFCSWLLTFLFIART